MAKRFGEFVVEREVARGGQGVVYEARRGDGGERVALKLLLDPDEWTAKRMRHEGEVLSRIRHPGVVRVLDHGVLDGVPYLAMEFVEGESLEDVLKHQGVQTPEWSAGVLANVASTLADLHAQGIVHRDLKPDNIIIERRTGRPLLVDFGILRRDTTRFGALGLDAEGPLTTKGEIKGTPSYMAPEQADPRFGTEGPLTDVYALGATLFALLTGEPPFVGPAALNVIQMVVTEPARDPRSLRPDLPPALAELCLQALEKTPGDRPLSAAVFAEELVALSQASAEAPRSRGFLFGGVAAAGLVGLLGLGIALSGGEPPDSPVDPPPADGDDEGAATAPEPDPVDPEAELRRAEAEALLLQVRARASVRDWQAADDALERARELEPEWVEPELSRSVVLQMSGRLEEGVEQGLEVVRRFPNEARAFANLGGALMGLGRYSEAEEVVDRAIELEPEKPVHLVQRAEIRLKLERFQETREDCLRAIRLGAKGHVHGIMGEALWLSHDDVGAERAYDQAILEEPDNADSWLRRARLKSNRGDLAGALADANQAVEAQPRLGPVYAERARLSLQHARALMRERGPARPSLERARQDTERALQLGDRNPVTRVFHAEACLALGDSETALRDAQELSKIAPDMPGVPLLEGNAHAQLGQFAEAIPCYDRALRLGEAQGLDQEWMDAVRRNRDRANLDLEAQRR